MDWMGGFSKGWKIEKIGSPQRLDGAAASTGRTDRLSRQGTNRVQ
jgi:hypothetical protein